MGCSGELITMAMDLVAVMAVEKIADDEAISANEALVGFLSSDTCRELYDDDLKLWWDGPYEVAEEYEAEQSVD